MEAESDFEFRFLRDHFRAGIARDWRPGDTAAASALHPLLVETGGEVFAAEAGTFDPKLFEAPDDGSRTLWPVLSLAGFVATWDVLAAPIASGKLPDPSRSGAACCGKSRPLIISSISA